MEHQKKSVLVSGGDTWAGVYAARALLHSKSFAKVCVGVTNKESEIARSLEREGAQLHQWDPHSVDSISQAFQGINSLALIPFTTMELGKLTMNVLSAAERSKVEHALLWSVAEPQHMEPKGGSGSGQVDLESGRKIMCMIKDVEDHFLKSKIPSRLITRITFPMQNLFYFSDVIQNRAVLPLGTGHGKFAPVSLKDVGCATATLLSQGIPQEHKNQVYTFTGAQLISAHELVDHANRALNAKITLQDMALPEFQELLDKLVKVGQMSEFEKAVMVYENYRIREGKLTIKTNDLQRILHHGPASVEQFFADNRDAFRPGGSALRLVDRWALCSLH